METKLVLMRVWSTEWPEGGGKRGAPVVDLDLPLTPRVDSLLADGWVIQSHALTYAGLSLFVSLHLVRDESVEGMQQPR